jgi:hypothetical protein
MQQRMTAGSKLQTKTKMAESLVEMLLCKQSCRHGAACDATAVIAVPQLQQPNSYVLALLHQAALVGQQYCNCYS